jgi:hypothetical protein
MSPVPDFSTTEGVTGWLVEKAGQSGPYWSLDELKVRDFGTSKAFLTRWYRSFGFIPNRGRRADLSVSGTMIRFPSTK